LIPRRRDDILTQNYHRFAAAESKGEDRTGIFYKDFTPLGWWAGSAINKYGELEFDESAPRPDPRPRTNQKQPLYPLFVVGRGEAIAGRCDPARRRTCAGLFSFAPLGLEIESWTNR